MGGEWASGAVLVSETWPAEHRGKAIGIMQSGWALGYILAALLALIVMPTLGWRWLFALGVLPALFILWVRRQVHEPTVWSARQKPAMEATARVLFGMTRPTGKLPVTIPAADGSVLYPYGHGLSY